MFMPYKDPEAERAYQREHYLANKDKRAAQIKAARQARRAADPEKYREQCRRLTNEWRERVKREVFDHYGRTCACCGSDDRPTIDHIAGDGKEHKMELFGSTNSNDRLFAWIRRNGFPEGFQTLCVPCNSSKNRGPACRISHG